MPSNIPHPDDLRASVIARFRAVALTPAGEKGFPIGPATAKRLGYDAAEVDALPSWATESFCGVGNPFALGWPRPGQSVLDLGCGAGFDTVLAARRAGPAGRVIGVDMTPDMIARARHNADRLGLSHVAFVLAEADRLPIPDASVDLVISNGVFNLCLDKPGVLREVSRVLRPGGRLQMADILLHEDVTMEDVAGKGEWSD